MSTARSIRRAAERQAAKFNSTGPKTTEGKAVSCLNRLKHGLTGAFRLLEFESQSQWTELAEALRSEHAPATPTETLLVDRMAEHVWLSQRAQRLQDAALLAIDDKTFALYCRYQTTNDRGFHRCLSELRAIRRERQRSSRQFESQNAVGPAAMPKTEPQTQTTTPPSATSERPVAAAVKANTSNRKKTADAVTSPKADKNGFAPLEDFMPNGRHHKAALHSPIS